MSATPDPEIVITEAFPIDGPAPDASQAVARCSQVWDDAYAAEFLKRQSVFDAKDAAVAAYSRAMPTPSSEDGIRDFIACVTHGILLGAFQDKQASQLLYAAQVASGALTRARKAKPRKDFRPPRRAT